MDRLIRNQDYVDQVKDNWVKIFNLLTYIGYGKDDLYARLDAQFGKENWLPAHSFDGEIVSRYQGYVMYDESYYHFLKENTSIREWITNTASEVMDFGESNLLSGLDLANQEGPATHLQDISVRRVLTRLKLEDEGIEYDPENLPIIPIFEGDHIVQIRDHKSEGFVLNPGQVPFHKPELGLDTLTERWRNNWWPKDSAEDIYQRNKVLLVNPEVLEVFLAMLGKEAVFFAEDKSVYYEFEPGRPDELFFRKGKDVRRLANEGNFDGYCEITQSPKKKFSDLVRVGTQYLQINPDLGKKKMSFPRLNKILAREKDWAEEIEFNIDALAEADPFGLSGSDDSGDLRDVYIGCVSAFMGTVLQTYLSNSSSAVGSDKVITTYSDDARSRVVSVSDFKEHKYFIELKNRVDHVSPVIRQFKALMEDICQEKYEKVDELSWHPKDTAMSVEYHTDNLSFCYQRSQSGDSGFSFNKVNQERVQHIIRSKSRN